MAAQKYITGVTALSEYLGMKKSTIHKNIQNGIIPKKKIGVNLVFEIKEIDSLIK